MLVNANLIHRGWETDAYLTVFTWPQGTDGDDPDTASQFLVQQRTIKRPKLQNGDRCSWAWLSRVSSDWKSTLIIVKPETVVKWHRQRFKLYWRRKSEAGTVGQRKISQEIRDLIWQMSRENPTWGAARIQSALKFVGFEVADSTVAILQVSLPG